ncbi:hypothetical protein PFLUV_G00015250 [Perca fluviatilis]|uniref:Ig-like domain-containing protein n=1 Tax=Perca fluviatilis TaxID=8168 RepID=A0A6A5FL83_PERFL|nr:hypothetical protein PFLUV_G00015250 [Perca fluviatilis]
MRLKVLRPDEVVRGADCEPLVAVAPTQEVIPLQEGKMLHCPDLQEAGRMVGENTTVTWYHVQRSNSVIHTEVRLVCTALFPFLDSFWEIWWTVDGKTLEKLADNRFTNINRQVMYDFEDRTEESVLVIKDFQPEDVYREFNCSVKNKKGFETRRAQLQEEDEMEESGAGFSRMAGPEAFRYVAGAIDGCHI